MHPKRKESKLEEKGSGAFRAPSSFRFRGGGRPFCPNIPPSRVPWGADMKTDEELLHDFREGLSLAKGWLEGLIKGGPELDEMVRQEAIAGALHGCNKLMVVLEQLEGSNMDEIRLPEERTAEDLMRLAHFAESNT